MTTIDLHFHSTCSDGKTDLAPLAALLKSSGIRYTSLTDHDTVAGISRLQSLLPPEVTVIPGVELTVLYSQREIHILAYDFDLAAMHDVLAERQKLVHHQKRAEITEGIKLFKKEGFSVPDARPDPNKPAGLTLALAIYADNQNIELLRKRHQHVPNKEEFYALYQAPGALCATKRSGVDLAWIQAKVRPLASDIILAHPFVPVSVLLPPLKNPEVEKLIESGLDGVEVYHNNTSDEQINYLEDLVSSRKLKYTGGSDNHGRDSNSPLGTYGNSRKVPNFQLTNFGPT